METRRRHLTGGDILSLLENGGHGTVAPRQAVRPVAQSATSSTLWFAGGLCEHAHGGLGREGDEVLLSDQWASQEQKPFRADLAQLIWLQFWTISSSDISFLRKIKVISSPDTI